MIIQSAVPMEYDGIKYFENDLGGMLNYLYTQLQARAEVAGVRMVTRPKTKVVYTANLRGFEHYYDKYMIMEAEFAGEGDEENGKQETSEKEDL